MKTTIFEPAKFIVVPCVMQDTREGEQDYITVKVRINPSFITSYYQCAADQGNGESNTATRILVAGAIFIADMAAKELDKIIADSDRSLKYTEQEP